MADATLRAASRAGFISDMKSLPGLRRNPVYRDGGKDRLASVFYWLDLTERADISGPYRYLMTPATFDDSGNLLTDPVYAPGRYFNLRLPARAFLALVQRSTTGILPGGTVILGATGLPDTTRTPGGVWGSPPKMRLGWA